VKQSNFLFQTKVNLVKYHQNPIQTRQYSVN